jgi:hypothetical protein
LAGGAVCVILRFRAPFDGSASFDRGASSVVFACAPMEGEAGRWRGADEDESAALAFLDFISPTWPFLLATFFSIGRWIRVEKRCDKS